MDVLKDYIDTQDKLIMALEAKIESLETQIKLYEVALRLQTELNSRHQNTISLLLRGPL